MLSRGNRMFRHQSTERIQKRPFPTMMSDFIYHSVFFICIHEPQKRKTISLYHRNKYESMTGFVHTIPKNYLSFHIANHHNNFVILRTRPFLIRHFIIFHYRSYKLKGQCSTVTMYSYENGMRKRTDFLHVMFDGSVVITPPRPPVD